MSGTVPKTTRLFFSPTTYTVTNDSEFEVSLFIDTADLSVNTLDLHITFPANIISVVTPSSGTSLVSSWTSPPTYSNSRGTIDFAGLILGGTKTDSGLVEKITFRAKKPGMGSVMVQKTSRVLLNDGLGTQTQLETAPLKISVESKAAEGVVVISSSHPFPGSWSNNPNPVFSWDTFAGSQGYSYVFDDKPFTVPDDTIDSTSADDTQASYEKVKDGVWYFHMKAKTGKAWTTPTNYTVRIDTSPPEAFTPTAETLLNSSGAKTAAVGQAAVSFFSNDALSGVDHYEVGVLDSASAPDTAPGFFESVSPYFLNKQNSGSAGVISNTLVTVRAIDRAGNVRDETITVKNSPQQFLIGKIKDNVMLLAVGSLVLLILLIVVLVAFMRRRVVYADDVRELIKYASLHDGNAANRASLPAAARQQNNEESLYAGLNVMPGQTPGQDQRKIRAGRV